MRQKKGRNPFSAIHSVMIIGWTVLATLFIGTIVIMAAFFSKTGNIPHLLARTWAKTIIWISGAKVTVKGASNLRPGTSYIYMANHQSNFDIPILLGRLPVQFRWLAKAELFKIPIFSHAMKGCGYISIDRSNRKSAFQSLDLAAKTIREGTSVMVFPEGTRSIDGKIKPFKKGGFVLAVDAGVPVVPIVISGTWSIMPKDSLLIRPQPVVMEILKPIPTSDYTRKTKDALIQEVGAVIKERLNHLRTDREIN